MDDLRASYRQKWIAVLEALGLPPGEFDAVGAIERLQGGPMTKAMPEALQCAVAKLSATLVRVDASKAAMQDRVRRMMADDAEAALPLSAMRSWPEYAEQEAAEAALRATRRTVEVQARAWGANTTSVATRTTIAELRSAVGDEGGREATPPPDSLKPEEVRAALLAAQVDVSGEVRGVAIRRASETYWYIDGEYGSAIYNLDLAVAAVLREAPRIAARTGDAIVCSVCRVRLVDCVCPARAVRDLDRLSRTMQS